MKNNKEPQINYKQLEQNVALLQSIECIEKMKQNSVYPEMQKHYDAEIEKAKRKIK